MVLTAALGAIAQVPVGPAAEADELAGMCYDCHGSGGLSADSDIPILAGQAYTVIEDNLLAFRAGERPCTETPFRHGDTSRAPTSMCEIAGALSDEQIAGLAEHFEALEYRPAQQAFDPSRVAAGRAVHQRGGCEACHAGEGRQTNGLACRLAGQWLPYLQRAFEQIRSGERAGPTAMTDAIRGFSDEDILNLLNFYASQQQ